MGEKACGARMQPRAPCQPDWAPSGGWAPGGQGAADPSIVSGALLGVGIVICWPSLILFGFLIAGFAARSSSIVIPWALATFRRVSPFLIV